MAEISSDLTLRLHFDSEKANKQLDEVLHKLKVIKQEANKLGIQLEGELIQGVWADEASEVK